MARTDAPGDQANFVFCGMAFAAQLLTCALAGFDSAASSKVTAGALTAANRPMRRSTARRSREVSVVSDFFFDI